MARLALHHAVKRQDPRHGSAAGAAGAVVAGSQITVVILQALLSLVTKSAGKILNAIFGWAVRALFGRTSSRDGTLLSGLVAAAVAWPLLFVGLVLPRIAALVLGFVPIPHWVPGWTIRVVWLVLALVIPLAMGIAVTARGAASLAHESIFKRLARGLPITIGLAAAFLIMFVSVPVMRLYALLRRRISADVPLVTAGDAYHRVAATLVQTLNRHGFGLHATPPGWWVSAPTRLLGWFGGDAFRRFVPEHLENYASPQLTISFYASGVLLRGQAHSVTWAQGLIAEVAIETDGLQTLHAAPQDLEKRIKQVWKTSVARSSDRSSPLPHGLGALTAALGKLDADLDEWQVLYRQLLQLNRAARGDRPLFEATLAQNKGEGATQIPHLSTNHLVPASAEELAGGSPRSSPDSRTTARLWVIR